MRKLAQKTQTATIKIQIAIASLQSYSAALANQLRGQVKPAALTAEQSQETKVSLEHINCVIDALEVLSRSALDASSEKYQLVDSVRRAVEGIIHNIIENTHQPYRPMPAH